MGDARTIAAWLSGYFHGKRNNLTVDLQAVESAADRVQSYCYDQTNWGMPVMKAIEQLNKQK